MSNPFRSFLMKNVLNEDFSFSILRNYDTKSVWIALPLIYSNINKDISKYTQLKFSVQVLTLKSKIKFKVRQLDQIKGNSLLKIKTIANRKI